MNYIVEHFVIVLGLLVAVNTPMSTDESCFRVVGSSHSYPALHEIILPLEWTCTNGSFTCRVDGKDVSLSFPVNTASGGPITATATIPSDCATVGLHTLYCSSYSIVITATATSSATSLVSSTVGSVAMSDGISKTTSLATSEPSPSPSPSNLPLASSSPTSDTPGDSSAPQAIVPFVCAMLQLVIFSCLVSCFCGGFCIHFQL